MGCSASSIEVSTAEGEPRSAEATASQTGNSVAALKAAGQEGRCPVGQLQQQGSCSEARQLDSQDGAGPGDVAAAGALHPALRPTKPHEGQSEHAPAPHRKHRRASMSTECEKQLEVVNTLYLKVLDDESLKGFYDHADMARIFRKQISVVTMMFGDKEILLDQIQGMDLRKIHIPMLLKMGLSLEHWRLFVAHFEQTLDETPGIPFATKERAKQLIRMTDHMFRPVEPAELEKYGFDAQGNKLPGTEGDAAGGDERGSNQYGT